MTILNGLIIEDDEIALEELRETLPKEIDDFQLVWSGCKSFDEGARLLESRRFDIVVTDIYVNEKGHAKNYSFEETGAQSPIQTIRNQRFCPVLAITDGSKPDNFPISPFIGYANKANPRNVVEVLETLIRTMIPGLAQRLHDSLDRDASVYLWGFLETYWDSLPHDDPNVLERLIRRRAALLLSKLDKNSEELSIVEGLEYYIYPSIAGDEYRLGEIIRHKTDGTFSVILTPHCHLVVQPNSTEPRAEYVLTVKTVDAKSTIAEKFRIKTNNKSADDISDSVRKRIQGPAQVGKPAGRYWFLPKFIEIPHLYCDFLQLMSIEFSDLSENYEKIAVLDTPFAESLQASFTAFYSAVGTPNLDPPRFSDLYD